MSQRSHEDAFKVLTSDIQEQIHLYMYKSQAHVYMTAKTTIPPAQGASYDFPGQLITLDTRNTIYRSSSGISSLSPEGLGCGGMTATGAGRSEYGLTPSTASPGTKISCTRTTNQTYHR